MRRKRNLVAMMMASMVVLSTITAFAAEKRSTKTYTIDGDTKLTAYAYIIDSGFAMHNGTATGSLTGTDRAAAGNYVITGKFGSSENYMRIGLSYGDYYEYKMKSGWFSKVTTSICAEGSDEELVSASVSD